MCKLIPQNYVEHSTTLGRKNFVPNTFPRPRPIEVLFDCQHDQRLLLVNAYIMNNDNVFLKPKRGPNVRTKNHYWNYVMTLNNLALIRSFSANWIQNCSKMELKLRTANVSETVENFLYICPRYKGIRTNDIFEQNIYSENCIHAIIQFIRNSKRFEGSLDVTNNLQMNSDHWKGWLLRQNFIQDMNYDEKNAHYKLETLPGRINPHKGVFRIHLRQQNFWKFDCFPRDNPY